MREPSPELAGCGVDVRKDQLGLGFRESDWAADADEQETEGQKKRHENDDK